MHFNLDFVCLKFTQCMAEQSASCMHGMAWHGMAWMPWHGMAWHGMACQQKGR
jgi:hypothetical protein